MTELETEVKIEREVARRNIPNVNAFSSSSLVSSVQKDLEKFETYKPADLNEIFNKLEGKTENKQERKFEDDTDLDRFTKIDSDDSPIIMSKTIAVDEPKLAVRINLRGKLIIFVASVAFILFSFLAIFNAFTISKLNSSITHLNEEISRVENELNNNVLTYNLLSSEGRIRGEAASIGMSDISSENVHALKIENVNVASQDEIDSNWFNDFCDWMTRAFGD